MPQLAFSPYLARGRSSYRNRGSGDYLRLTSGLPASSGSWTACAWVHVRPHAFTYHYFLGLSDALASAPNEDVLGRSPANVSEMYSSGASAQFSTDWLGQVGARLFVACGASGTGAGQMFARVRRVEARGFNESVTGTTSSFTPAAFWIGNDSYDDWTDHNIWNVMLWDAALSAEELLRQSYSPTPVRPRNLLGWWPLEGNLDQLLLDYSGNGHHLTRAGSPRAEPWFLPASVLPPLPRRRAVFVAAGGVTGLGEDSVTLADASSAAIVFAANATDGVTLSDVATTVIIFAATGTDSTTLTDAATAGLSITAQGGDAATLLDAGTSFLFAAADGADATTLIDAGTGSINFVASSADAVLMQDAGSAQIVFSAAGQETVVLQDAGIGVLITQASSSDAVTLTDIADGTVIQGGASLGEDSATLNDSATAVVLFFAEGAEAVTLADAATAVMETQATASDAVSLSDSAIAGLTFFVEATDAASLSDEATATVVSVPAGASGISRLAAHYFYEQKLKEWAALKEPAVPEPGEVTSGITPKRLKQAVIARNEAEVYQKLRSFSTPLPRVAPRGLSEVVPPIPSEDRATVEDARKLTQQLRTARRKQRRRQQQQATAAFLLFRL